MNALQNSRTNLCRKLMVIGLSVSVILFGCSLRQNGPRKTLHLGIFAGSNWGVPGNTEYRIIDSVIERFESEHPGFDVVYDSGIRKADYSEWLAQKVIQAEIPDVFMILDQDFPLFAQIGALKNLDHYIYHDQSFDCSAFYSSALQQGKFDSKQYGIPYESNPRLMCINASLLEDNQIPIPDADWTTEDFMQISKALSLNRNSSNDSPHLYGVSNYSWSDAVAAFGERIFSENGTSTNLESEKMGDAIRFWLELNELQEENPVYLNSFDQGNTAFCPITYAQFKAYKPYPWKVKMFSAFDWCVTAMPSADGQSSGTVMDSLLFAISSKSKFPDASWELVKMLTLDEQTQKMQLELSSGLPSSKLFKGTEDLNEDLDWNLIHEIMESASVEQKFAGSDQILSEIDIHIRSNAPLAEDLDLFLIDLDQQMSAKLQELIH